MSELERGFSLTIGIDLFSDIMCESLGLERGAFKVVDVTTNGWHRAVEICSISDSERFPEIVEGEKFKPIRPILKNVPIEKDGEIIGYKTIFEGLEQ
jgi:hypothetical protein